MLIKTNDLVGKSLNWAVATATDGFSFYFERHVEWLDDVEWVMNDEGIIQSHTEIPSNSMNRRYDAVDWSPSTNWGQGGPIIEREKIEIGPYDNQEWRAMIFNNIETRFMKELTIAPTPLIAAMRCYVASKMGDTIEVPDQLAERK